MPDSINEPKNASQAHATEVPLTETAKNPRVEQKTMRQTKTHRDRSRHQVRRLTQGAVLTALALILSIIERWIPLDLIVPIPGIKLGLANIVTLFALLRLSPLDAAIILVVRSLIMGLITGPSTLMFSLAGGTLALLVMWFLSRWEGRAFSMIGISLAGAAAHNIGQISVAVILLSEPLLLMMYLPPLLLASMVTGTLTGIAAFPIAARFAKPQPVKTERAI